MKRLTSTWILLENQKKNAVDYEGDGITIVVRTLGKISKTLRKRSGELEMRRSIVILYTTALFKSDRSVPET